MKKRTHQALSAGVKKTSRFFLINNIILKINNDVTLLTESGKEIPLRKSDLFFIGRGQYVDFITSNTSDVVDVRILVLNDRVLNSIIKKMSLSVIGHCNDSDVNNFYSINNDNYVDMVFEYLCSGAGQIDILKEFSLMLLLSFFSLNKSFYTSLQKSLYVDFKGKVHCLISDNLHESWSVNKVAKLLNVSSATLKRKLLMENTTFTNIFLDIRMNNAFNLLRTTSLSISQISHNSGFRSASHFCSCFKNYFGLSPGKMQKQLKKQLKLNFFEL